MIVMNVIVNVGIGKVVAYVRRTKRLGRPSINS